MLLRRLLTGDPASPRTISLEIGERGKQCHHCQRELITDDSTMSLGLILMSAISLGEAWRTVGPSMLGGLV